MSFGKRNAPATFQTMNNCLISDLIECEDYMIMFIVIVVNSDTFEEHPLHIRAFL